MKYNAIEILENLNLDEYFLHLGFEFLSKESSTKWRKYLNPENNSKYLVSKNNETGQWFYRNTQDIDKKFKNIFDFMKEYDSEVKSFLEDDLKKNYLIITKLNQYLDPSFQSEVKSNKSVIEFGKKIKKKERLSKTTDFNKTPIYDYTYLVNKRKISKEVIDHPLVKSTIFNTIFQFNNGHQNINTAFAKYNEENEIVALEVYYESSTKSSSLVIGKDNIRRYEQYLWHSQVDNTKPFSHIVFSESGKDALSYFELMLSGPDSKLDSFNPLLVSIAGNLDNEGLKLKQLERILKLGDCSKAKFLTIADNDIAGNKYDVYFLKVINNILSEEKIDIKENPNYFEFQFQNSPSEDFLNKINIENKIIQEKILDNNNFGKFYIYKPNENKLLVPKNLEFYPYHNSIIETFNEKIFQKKQIKFLSHKVKLKELNGDLDWNAYLMYKKDKRYFLERQKRHLDAKIKKKTTQILKQNKIEKKNEISY